MGKRGGALSEGRSEPGQVRRVLLPGSIRVSDVDAREIELCATSEAIDSFGTMFAYEASRDAFDRWAGNVREMHERKAVGRRVVVRADDGARKVYVRVRISTGAEDTWQKILDGTLSGASIGASNVSWAEQRVAGRTVPVATKYDLVELSLVDLASNPDAQGVTFVRDGVPDQGLLDDVALLDRAAPATEPQGEHQGDPPVERVIREGSGSLSTEDPVEAIAAAALRRGHEQIAQGTAVAPRPVGGSRAAHLAALGAPGYVVRGESADRAGSAPAPGEGSGGYAVAQSYDVDGDHESAEDYDVAQSGPRADDLVHAPDQHSHAGHTHAHSGGMGEADGHRHSGAHQHEDGTSHEHDHLHDHAHHDHATETEPSTSQVAGSQRVMSGHAHPHVHLHGHGHYYRVADGRAVDSRLVTGEQLRVREVVSRLAFVASGATEGRALTVEQYRIAAGIEQRLEREAAERAQGAFSRNPLGPADIGTPAAGGFVSTDELIASGAHSTGQGHAHDRDGDLVAADDDGGGQSTTGTLDVSEPADGFEELSDASRRGVVADVARVIQAEVARVLAGMTGLEQRLAKVEAQPQAGGPVLHAGDVQAAERRVAFSPGGNGAQVISSSDQLRALESLAGRLRDPESQVAVATEMIRLQQEAAGMGPAYQVMPRAGAGWR